jgi:hypothetical protein
MRGVCHWWMPGFRLVFTPPTTSLAQSNAVP